MAAIIELYQDWPVVVQGALGAALFWAILYVGEHVFSIVIFVLSKISRDRRESYLVNRKFQLAGIQATDIKEQTAYAASLWYRASRDLIVAIMWLVLGLLFAEFVGVWSMIGYFGSLYHLFFAFHAVKPVLIVEGEADKLLEEVTTELDQLRQKL